MAKPTIGTLITNSVNGTGQGNAANPLNLSSVVIGGSARYLLVVLAWNDDANERLSSVTIDPGGPDETSLAVIAGTSADIEDDGFSEIWGVKNPPLGTFTVRCILDNGLLVSGHIFAATAYPLTGVDQGTPVGDSGAFAGTTSNPGVTLSSSTEELVLGCAFIEDQGSMQIQSPGVEDAEITPADDTFASGHEDGQTSVTIDWNCTSDKVVASAVSLNGVASSTEQEGFRFYDDDANESSATALETQDTNLSRAKNTNTRLRGLSNMTGDRPSESTTVQYRKVGDADSEWRDVPL